jgi:hypothetical protein
MPVTQNDLDWFAARLSIAVYDTNQEYRKSNMATPKLQGLAEAMKKLEHDLEDGAGKLMVKVDALGPRGQAALAKGHQKVDSKAALIGEIETFVTALEGANGGDPLDDSSNTSDQSKPTEPAASWGQK